MKRYTVTWGPYEPLTVDACDETEAWACFCAKYGEALRHPNSHQRTVAEVVKAAKPEPKKSTIVESKVLPEPAV